MKVISINTINIPYEIYLITRLHVSTIKARYKYRLHNLPRTIMEQFREVNHKILGSRES